MKHTVKQRVLITVAATAIVAAAGAGAGYLMGRALALKLAATKLTRDATQVIAQGDAFSDESRALLATLNASPYPFCSEAEIAYFRKLVFQASYLRDAGRILDGRLVCSAAISREDLPTEQFKADLVQPDGTLIYWNLPPFRVGKLLGIVLQLGDSYVVYAPRLFENQGTPSSHFIYSTTGYSNWHAGSKTRNEKLKV